MTMTHTTTCQGCLAPLNPVDAMLSATSVHGLDLCTPCVHARAKAAQSSGRCRCGSKRREGAVLGQPGRRQWIPCERCLGTVRQVG